MFVQIDVEEELDDRRPFLGQHPLEFVDVSVARLPTLCGHQGVDSYHQDILIVAAIEDGDLTRSRSMFVHPPQVVVGQLLGSGYLETGHHHPLGIDAPKHVTDRAVLAARVHSLQDHEHLVSAFCPQQALQLAEALVEDREMGATFPLAACEQRRIVGVPL